MKVRFDFVCFHLLNLLTFFWKYHFIHSYIIITWPHFPCSLTLNPYLWVKVLEYDTLYVYHWSIGTEGSL